MNIPAKEWNAEKGKMEDTSLPHWQEYYRKLKEHEEHYRSIQPVKEDFSDDDHYKDAYSAWVFNKAVNAPNKPGYYLANND